MATKWYNYFSLTSKACFGYDNSVSLQTAAAGNVGAAVLPLVASGSGVQTNDVRRKRNGLLTLQPVKAR